ncbi:Bifunctional ligase/repressor BirA [Methyloligella halotolerans]|uniref:biotin--[biotin carboxyl-carrier protein] ligase n=1 Tax=Methyloligella halotolerans TaxID=1177755 RepID=A0A1E2S2D9_9HYPH|nr:biotin--[acetyl-CoA-carboxylase] ligase [Methyloligella halotolerans]ODA68505.1 Bifunctional ligase/repressor BirA [Methyloligella halotolerans]
MAVVSTTLPKLPQGYRLLRLDSTDSTNAEALRRASAGEDGPLWIWSARQSRGRGRSGRDWQSQTGNLFASLLISPSCPLATAVQLGLVAGLAAHQAAATVIREAGKAELLPKLTLKWPNDVFLGSAKLAGILVENAATPDENRSTVVIGTGINLAHHPETLPKPATSLAAHDMEVQPAEMLRALSETTDRWLKKWSDGAGFQEVRSAWMDRANAIGDPISVQLPNERLEGRFQGLDATGALRLELQDHKERRITAGDVFFPSA